MPSVAQIDCTVRDTVRVARLIGVVVHWVSWLLAGFQAMARWTRMDKATLTLLPDLTLHSHARSNKIFGHSVPFAIHCLAAQALMSLGLIHSNRAQIGCVHRLDQHDHN